MAVAGNNETCSSDRRAFYKLVVCGVLNRAVKRARKVHKSAVRADVVYRIVRNIRRKEKLGFQLSPDFVEDLTTGESVNEIRTSCVQAPVRRSAPKDT